MPLSFLDDKGPGTQHPGAGAPGSPAPAGEKKKEDHRQQILVGASIVGVIVAWLTFKSVKGGASASGTPVSSASVPGTTTGTVAGSGMDTDAYNGFTSYLQDIQGEVTQLSNTINTQANSTATLPATQSTALANGLYQSNVGGGSGWIYQVTNGVADQTTYDYYTQVANPGGKLTPTLVDPSVISAQQQGPVLDAAGPNDTGQGPNTGHAS